MPLRAGVRKCVAEPAALLGAHRAVVEREPQVTDACVLVVGDLAVGVVVGDLRVERDLDLRDLDVDAGERERVCGRQLEVPVRRRVPLLEVRYPHRAVERGSTDRAVTLRDEFAGPAAQRPLRVRPELVKVGAFDCVEHAGVTVARAHLPQNTLGQVGLPVDRANLLGHQRQAWPRRHSRQVGRYRWRFADQYKSVDRVEDGLDRRATDLVPVQAALGRLPHAELARRPHLSGVDILDGLQHGHSPIRLIQLDCPIQR